MRTPDYLGSVNTIIRTPAIADLEVAHLAIEHCDAGRNALDEYLEQFFARSKARFTVPDGLFGPFPIGHVEHHPHPSNDGTVLAECRRVARRNPPPAEAA
jgi:hypothetical protein